jgi:hypothetical protein
MENSENMENMENMGKTNTNTIDDILEYDTAYRKKKLRLANYIVSGILTFLDLLEMNVKEVLLASTTTITPLNILRVIVSNVFMGGIKYGITFGVTILWEMLILWISKPTHKFMDKIRKLSAKKQLDEIHKERVKRIFMAVPIFVSVIAGLVGLCYLFLYKINPDEFNKLTLPVFIWLGIKIIITQLIWPIIIALTKPPLSDTMRDDSEEDTLSGGRRKNKTYKAKNKKYKNII